jgi:hypothetical protein
MKNGKTTLNPLSLSLAGFRLSAVSSAVNTSCLGNRSTRREDMAGAQWVTAVYRLGVE